MNCTENHVIARRLRATPAQADRLTKILSAFILAVIFGITQFSDAFGQIVHQESRTGAASGSITVSTSASLTGANGQLYLAAISTRPKVSVSSISGLGLVWTQVKSKCGGRNTTSIEVWMAQGTPSGSGVVTATFVNAPTTAVITVSRYSGVATSNPIGAVIAGNVNGLNAAGACTGGTDGNSYSFNLTTTVNEALVYGAVAIKDRAHTPGANYTERAEIHMPNGITTSGVAVEDRTVASASTVTVDGTLDGAADWALVALEIKPGPLAAQHTLTVNTVGSGSVTLNPPGGIYNPGTVVTLTATPASGFQFSGWSGDLSGTTNPAMITMDGNKTVTANFTLFPLGPVVHEESRTGSASGSITVTTAGTLSGVSGQLYLAAISTRPKVSVSSISGLGLVWTQVKSKCGGRNTTSIEVWMAQGTPSGSGVVTATFVNAPTTAVITVSRYSGVATSNPIGAVIAGNVNGLNAAGACTGGTDGNSYAFNLTTTVNNALVYGAVAIKDRAHTPGANYTERAEIHMPNGITTSGVAVEDRTVASASTVTVDGTLDGAADWALVALEIKPGPPAAQHTLTVNTVGSGSVTLNPAGGTYSVGTVVTLTATPASGFQFSGWSGDLSGTTNPAMITMDGNKTVTATFTELPVQHTLTVNTVGSGSVTLNPPGGTYSVGTVVTLTATPASGFQFSGWSGDLSGATNPAMITMDGNKTVTATFAPLPKHRLAINLLGAGTVAANPSDSLLLYHEGTVVTLTATPAAGFQFTGWSGDLSGAANPTTITMNTSKTVMAIFTPTGTSNQIVHEETQTGGSANSTTVTTAANLIGVSGQLYLAAISTRPNLPVTGVSGLGLTWTLVKSQCSGRNNTNIEVWMAQGAPTINSAVTATFANPPLSAAIVVSRYSGVDQNSPVGNVISGNTLGLDGLCALGVDTSLYSFNLTTTRDGAVAYGAVAVRTRTHTPGSGYIERGEFIQGLPGSGAGVAVQDRSVASPATVAVNGTLSGKTDWAVVAIEIRPPAKLVVNTLGSGSVTLTPAGGTYHTGTLVTLTATAAAGFEFSGWSGDLTGSDNPTTITMDGQKTVIATFTPISSGNQISHEETQTGGSTSSLTVATSSNLTAVSGHLYLAAISTRPKVQVTGVSGLGLTWTLIKSQCSGRSNTMVEVWMAQGSPTHNSPVTATFGSKPSNAVIAVSRYSGAHASSPIGSLTSGNTVGADGPCTGGTDSNAYSFNLTTTVNDAVVYGAAALRSRTHTPGSGYTERGEIMQGTTGAAAAVAVQEQAIASPATIAVDGSLSGSTDWAMIALEIKPQSSSSAAKRAAQSGISAIPAAFQLEQNYPNPFNPSTMISFALSTAGQVTVNVYNQAGQLVRTLVQQEMAAGRHQVRWNGRNQAGKTVAAGFYLYQIVVRDNAGRAVFTETRRMLFVK
ncbi:MAG: InlB B-repeat-containing protein [candidate division KSB1 bacterium]|nr:InlB B-repeat-containing protein [candidate division KSB1 bacterium]MDZ7403218.1 InlB B-repeat-containing protein [candidate division KSB1 bacterium]